MDFELKRKDLHDTRFVAADPPAPAEGEALLRIESFGLTARDRVLSFAALGFDVAIEEILPTLRAGATVVLRSDAMLDTLDRFVDDGVRLRYTRAAER